MPPRYAYWTILIDGTATAFRAKEREELLPTFNQLRRKNSDVALRYFAHGKLWDSPEQSDWARRNKGALREHRSAAWRPGGTHADPKSRGRDGKDRGRGRTEHKRPPRDNDRRETGSPQRTDAPPTEMPPRQPQHGDAPRSDQGAPRHAKQRDGRRPDTRDGFRGKDAAREPWARERDARPRPESRERRDSRDRPDSRERPDWRKRPDSRPRSDSRQQDGARPPSDARSGPGSRPLPDARSGFDSPPRSGSRPPSDSYQGTRDFTPGAPPEARHRDPKSEHQRGSGPRDFDRNARSTAKPRDSRGGFQRDDKKGGWQNKRHERPRDEAWRPKSDQRDGWQSRGPRDDWSSGRAQNEQPGGRRDFDRKPTGDRYGSKPPDTRRPYEGRQENRGGKWPAKGDRGASGRDRGPANRDASSSNRGGGPSWQNRGPSNRAHASSSGQYRGPSNRDDAPSSGQYRGSSNRGDAPPAGQSRGPSNRDRRPPRQDYRPESGQGSAPNRDRWAHGDRQSSNRDQRFPKRTAPKSFDAKRPGRDAERGPRSERERPNRPAPPRDVVDPTPTPGAGKKPSSDSSEE